MNVGLYDRYLAFRIRREKTQLPETVALVLTERDLLESGAYETLNSVIHWAFAFDAKQLVIYVSVLDTGVVKTLKSQLLALDTPYDIAIRSPADDTKADAPVQVSIGLGGKHEFAMAVRDVAKAVERGELDPDSITEADIENQLVFQTAPDLVIKTGGERLSDFMIWQSVYSELYFTDVNWRNFRRRDYLRALRDYQNRKRRFGE